MTSSQSTLKAIVASFPRPNEGFVSEAESNLEPASWGSLGHPELCHRPCVYILKGSTCWQGASCHFCHHSRHSPIPKLDQEQRARFQALSEEDRVSLLIPHMREKALALAAGLPVEVEDFICVLKKFSNETSHIEPYDDHDHRRRSIPRKEFCRLKKTLHNMNLTALMKLLPSEDEELVISFQKLRLGSGSVKFQP